MEALLETYEGHVPLTRICCYILNNVAVQSDQNLYALMRREKRLRANLDISIKAFPKNERAVREFCGLTSRILNESKDSLEGGKKNVGRFGKNGTWQVELGTELGMEHFLMRVFDGAGGFWRNEPRRAARRSGSISLGWTQIIPSI